MIPTIKLGQFYSGGIESRKEVALKVRQACEDIGFFSLTDTEKWVPSEVLDATWEVTTDFFNESLSTKVMLCKDQEAYPFGYTPFEGELLEAGKASETNGKVTALPDLKEMFSIGPADPRAGFPPRLWPQEPPEFAEKWSKYYECLSALASAVLEIMAIALELPEGYFKTFTDHHASALRALNYPPSQPKPGQIRASAHTDYGVMTILKCGGPGLQVSKDTQDPVWVDVPFIKDSFVVNLGDLMRRWTNDRWKSTLHRVVNPPQGSVWDRRQSLAFFYNVNKDAVIECLTRETPKYQAVVAGDFLMSKHLASIQHAQGLKEDEVVEEVQQHTAA